ncbi:MAG: hypothetical protein JSR66_04400 [Proteobacteria bacterium]|nr:hypothetical protein [Pseudomonadota bacterium]
MASERATSPIPTITARPSPEEKAQFVELAASLGVSESALALTAIRALLDTNQPRPDVVRPEECREPANSRLTIRLRPGDSAAVRVRATRRGFKPSAYIAGLVRAHLTHSPPLPKNEVDLLKQAISVLTRLGHLLAAITREVAKEGILPPELAKQLSLTRGVVAGVERIAHDLVKAALIAWESKYD